MSISQHIHCHLGQCLGGKPAFCMPIEYIVIFNCRKKKKKNTNFSVLANTLTWVTLIRKLKYFTPKKKL